MVAHIRHVFGFLNLSTVRSTGNNLSSQTCCKPILLKLESESIGSRENKFDANILPKKAVNRNVYGFFDGLFLSIIYLKGRGVFT